MTRLEQLKRDLNSARIIKDHMKVTFLSTLIGEASIIGKNNGNRESTDAEVIQVLKKFEKGIKETLEILKARNSDESMYVPYLNELKIVERYLPSALSDSQVQSDIELILKENNLSLERKSQGTIVKILKERYGEQFDGAQVSRIFGAML